MAVASPSAQLQQSSLHPASSNLLRQTYSTRGAVLTLRLWELFDQSVFFLSVEARKLTVSESELASLNARRAPDQFLLDLVELADLGAGVPIGLLANGMVIVGSLSSAEALAKPLDVNRRRIVDRVEKPEGLTDGDWADIRDRFATRSVAGVKTFRKEAEELEADLQAFEETAAEGEQLPSDLERRLIARSNRTHITLVDVQVVAPGQSGAIRVPVIRVNLGQIAAWWSPETDGSGAARFGLFESDSD